MVKLPVLLHLLLEALEVVIENRHLQLQRVVLFLRIRLTFFYHGSVGLLRLLLEYTQIVLVLLSEASQLPLDLIHLGMDFLLDTAQLLQLLLFVQLFLFMDFILELLESPSEI